MTDNGQGRGAELLRAYLDSHGTAAIRERFEALIAERAINARLLARQTDLARQAETERDAAIARAEKAEAARITMVQSAASHMAFELERTNAAVARAEKAEAALVVAKHDTAETLAALIRAEEPRDAAYADAAKAEMVVAMACDALNTFAREEGVEECQSPLGQDEAGLRSLAERLVLRLREKVARADEQRDRAADEAIKLLRERNRARDELRALRICAEMRTVCCEDVERIDAALADEPEGEK